MDFAWDVEEPKVEFGIEEVEQRTRNPVSRLTKECVPVFEELLRIFPKNKENQGTHEQLEESLGDFMFWNKSHKVAEGGIDRILESEQELCSLIVGHLIEISTRLRDSQIPNPK